MSHKVVLCFVLLFGVGSPLDAEPLYTIKDITPDGYRSATAYDINSSGDAVGIAGRFISGSLEEAFFFYDHSAGTSTAFGVGVVSPRDPIFASGFAEAAINDLGAITGSAMFVGGVSQRRGFIYSGGASGSFTNLGTLAGATPSGIRPESDALDINDSGVATGTATSGAGTIPQENDNIDVYTGSASPITDIDGDLTTVTRGDFGRAINNRGQVVGSNEFGRATLFVGDAETTFLAGTSLGSVVSSANDLNEVGQITGSASDASYIFDVDDSTLRVLPNLGTGDQVAAKAINESGDVAGHADISSALSGQSKGFVHIYADDTSYILREHIVDLTFPGGTEPGDWTDVRTAWGINDDGWIVGVGDRRFSGESIPTSRAYLLIPATVVPEPSSAILIALTGAMIVGRRRRA